MIRREKYNDVDLVSIIYLMKLTEDNCFRLRDLLKNDYLMHYLFHQLKKSPFTTRETT